MKLFRLKWNSLTDFGKNGAWWELEWKWSHVQGYRVLKRHIGLFYHCSLLTICILHHTAFFHRWTSILNAMKFYNRSCPQKHESNSYERGYEKSTRFLLNVGILYILTATKISWNVKLMWSFVKTSYYCRVFMTPWLTITGSELDDWI
jgi:hypothetical protein